MESLRTALGQPVSRNRLASAPLLLGLLAVVAAVLFYSGLQFRSQLDRTRVASSDIRVWTVSQIEVDHQNLLYALSRFHRADVPRPEAEGRLRLAFDLFLSRVDVVSILLDAPEVPKSLNESLNKITVASQSLASAFDRMDMADDPALARFEAEVMALDGLVRNVALGALDHYAQDTEASRRQEEILWTRVLAATSVLLTIMTLAMFLTLRLRQHISGQFQDLQRASDTIRMVYEASLMAIVVTDSSGEILLFNSVAEQLLGWRLDEVRGRNVAEVIVPARLLPTHRKFMQWYRDAGPRALLDGTPVKTFVRRSDGREVPVELSIRANHDIAGRETLIAQIRDVSAQLAQEASLREARDEARHHAAARSMFIATMSHEMRTPLHGLLASLELIDEGMLDETARDLLQTARDCGNRSLQQITDVLHATQIDEVAEPLAPMRPVQIVRSIMDELRILARDNGNSLTLDLAGASEDRLWLGQQKTFSRVLYNLIGNAIKFTKNGSVTVSLRFSQDSKDRTSLHVEVRDTGIGIAPEDCARVFEPFFTSTSARQTDQRNHTGLGLSIARLGVRKMGGDLRLSSQLGIGTSFFFDIPLEAAVEDLPAAPAVTALTAPAPIKLTCLVVDDNEINLMLAARMLRKLGCTVDEATSGADAVTLALGKTYDVIFMDMNMPGGLSGRQTAGLIREGGQSRTAFIVALTADTTFRGDDMLESARMDHVLHKPFSRSDLVALLAPHSKDGQPAAANARQGGSDWPADVEDLFSLIGPAQARTLLGGVRRDIEEALRALSEGCADAADRVHKAAGSVGVVGLSDFCGLLQQAEIALRDPEAGSPRQMARELRMVAEETCKRIDRFLSLAV